MDSDDEQWAFNILRRMRREVAITRAAWVKTDYEYVKMQEAMETIGISQDTIDQAHKIS